MGKDKDDKKTTGDSRDDDKEAAIGRRVGKQFDAKRGQDGNVDYRKVNDTYKNVNKKDK